MPISSHRGAAIRRHLIALPCLILAARPIARSRADPIAEVSGIRFGADAGRTRIVLDVDQEVFFSAAVASLPPGLVISLPAVRWRLGDGPPSLPHGLVLGYLHGSTGSDRAWLVVKMKKPVRIARKLVLAPSQDRPLHRLVIDVEEAPAKSVPLATDAAATPPSSPELR